MYNASYREVKSIIPRQNDTECWEFSLEIEWLIFFSMTVTKIDAPAGNPHFKGGWELCRSGYFVNHVNNSCDLQKVLLWWTETPKTLF